ncbi:hypothetical protein MKX03_004660 [Papaver bracteatum]|nr:hypothetical protein MKX03_004660 [Papaver bracteatum]
MDLLLVVKYAGAVSGLEVLPLLQVGGGGGGGCLLTITWMLGTKIKVSLTSLKSSTPQTTSKSENRTIYPPILSCVGHYDSKFYLFAVDGVKKNGVMDLYLI